MRIRGGPCRHVDRRTGPAPARVIEVSDRGDGGQEGPESPAGEGRLDVRRPTHLVAVVCVYRGLMSIASTQGAGRSPSTRPSRSRH
jgi:hypothetical protein